MKNKKFGIFDFDGTIVDAMPTYFQLSSHIIEEKYGLDGKEFEQYSRKYTGVSLEELFSTFLEIKGKSSEKMEEYIKDFFVVANSMDFPVFEGAKETVEKMYKDGMKLFISTGSQTQKTRERLDKLGMLNYFSLVYGSSEVEKGPKHIKEFADFSGVSLEDFSKEAFFVGDGPGDMRIAKSCNVSAIGVTYTFDKSYLFEAGADFVLDKITDLVELDLDFRL